MFVETSKEEGEGEKILFDRQFIHFQSYFQWAKYKVFHSSFEIIFKYVSANQEMYSLHVCAWPIFQTTFSLVWVEVPLGCNGQFRNCSVKIVFFPLLFGFDWISPLLNHAIIGHVCWYCLAVSVPDWADWTPTVTVCIQNIYQPHGHKPHTLIIMHLGKIQARMNLSYNS